jgi:glycolate oxidase FAD binding subunit
VIYDEEPSLLIWEAVRDVTPFHDFARTPAILKLSIPPASMLDLVRVIEQIGGCEWYADAGGAWVWVGICHGSPEDKINTLRREIASLTGSAVLYRATEAVKKNTGIYSGKSAAMNALSKRIKRSFDPQNMFNPGRLYFA